MTVYLPKRGRTYRYDFVWKRRRFFGSTGQLTKRDAEDWEAAYKLRLRRKAGGLEPEIGPDETPRIQEWAEVYFDRVLKEGRITRPDRVADLLRVVLRFWGARPREDDTNNPPKSGEPYHDYRLGDPISDPDLIVAFEDWMAARGSSGQTKNQYRSTMRQLYKLAQQPRYRKMTGVSINPFDNIERDTGGTRDVTLSPEELRRLLAAASYHLRLAAGIGALAPKLRLSNILTLRWSHSFEGDLQYIRVDRHKTRARTGRPLVIPVTQQLRRILQDARQRQRFSRSDYVVQYRSRPIKQVRGAVRGAAKAAGLPYGRYIEGGLTFHTIRHSMATLLAELGESEAIRKAILGHERLETTQRYTHMRPTHEIAPLERLSDALPIEDLVTAPQMRASRRLGKIHGEPESDATKSAGKSGNRQEISGTRKKP